jgi:hypothetical protein
MPLARLGVALVDRVLPEDQLYPQTRTWHPIPRSTEACRRRQAQISPGAIGFRGRLPRIGRQHDLERCTLRRRPGHLQGPAQGLQTLLDAGDSEASRSIPAHHLVDGKASPIILEEGGDHLGISL